MTEESINEIIQDMNVNVRRNESGEAEPMTVADMPRNTDEAQVDGGYTVDNSGAGEAEREDNHINTIPETLDNQSTARISGAPWFEGCKNTDIFIIGAGGISSWTAMFLARTYPQRMSITDGDKVSGVNMAGQFYRISDIGSRKADSLARNIQMFTDNRIFISAYSYMVDEGSHFYGPDFVISGVDSMRSRKRIWTALVRDNFRGIYIDGRLSAETLQILCVDMLSDTDREVYEKTYLFDDEDADNTICSFKQTTYMAAMIGSLITNLVVNIINNKTNVLEYKVPFYTEYNSITTDLITLDTDGTRQ